MDYKFKTSLEGENTSGIISSITCYVPWRPTYKQSLASHSVALPIWYSSFVWDTRKSRLSNTSAFFIKKQKVENLSITINFHYLWALTWTFLRWCLNSNTELCLLFREYRCSWSNFSFCLPSEYFCSM